VPDTSSELVERSKDGDTVAFGQLVAETQGGVYNLAYSILGNHQETQDVTQEIYLRAWRGLPTFRGEARFSTWLYRIALNTCFNRRRMLRAQLRNVDNESNLDRLSSPKGDPVAITVDKEQKAALWAAVKRLPEKYRLVITLFYQRQLSYQEICEMLSLPLGTVKAHLNRARRALAKGLGLEREAQDAPL